MHAPEMRAQLSGEIQLLELVRKGCANFVAGYLDKTATAHRRSQLLGRLLAGVGHHRRGHAQTHELTEESLAIEHRLPQHRRSQVETG